MSKAVLTFSDADNGVSLHCDWGTEGYKPECHAHVAAIQVIRIMDQECGRVQEPEITTAEDVEQRLLAAMEEAAPKPAIIVEG